MKLSLRYKILILFALLLVSSVTAYTLLASRIFRDEKTALLYDVNHSVAVNVAAQLDAVLQQLNERIRLYIISEMIGGGRSYRLSPDYLHRANIAAIGLYRVDPTPVFWKKSGAIEAVAAKQLAAVPHLWRTRNGDFYYAVNIETKRAGRSRHYIAVARIDARPMLRVLQSSTPYESYLLDRSGNVLIHTNQGELDPENAAVDHPLLEQALKTSTSGVSAFEFSGDRWFGAFAPVASSVVTGTEEPGLYFVSQANQNEISGAIGQLIRQSVLFGWIVATIAFLVSILFARRLTRDLAHLTDRALRTGEGDLETKIRVKSKDEVGDLANTFNKMIQSLKESRDAIERYNRELEDKVADRTRELKEKNIALEELQEKLIKSTQLAAAGEVAGRTAHEVLNPLTAALARVEQLKGTGKGAFAEHLDQIVEAWNKDYVEGGLAKWMDSAKSPSHAMPGKTLFEEDLENLALLAKQWREEALTLGGGLEFVENQGQRIQRILDGMRELVRSSTVREPIHCQEIVAEAVASQSDLAERDGIQLTTEWGAQEDWVEVNRDELTQVLMNLLRNASQAVHARSGQGKIVVRAKNEGDRLLIDILDNGIGIREEARAKVFDQGYTTKPTSEGTGLGLAISRRYARAFGGDVQLLFSSPERGTCFRVSLPLNRTASTTQKVTREAG